MSICKISKSLSGRFSLNITLEQIQQHFPVDVVTYELEQRSEVFPSQQVPAIIKHESKIRLGHFTWGLIPSWAKEKKGTGHINARLETFEQKPNFRESFRKRRCLIFADGFYEWKADPENDNKKAMYYFQLPTGKPFAFAGLWDTWQTDYHGCTIINRGGQLERSGTYTTGCHVFRSLKDMLVGLILEIRMFENSKFC